MRFISVERFKIASLIITGILFLIPYLDRKCRSDLILMLSGVTLTLYIVAAVLEEHKKKGRW